MTAPRPREQRRPPSPPDRGPPRRGGGSSPSPYRYASAGRPADAPRLCGARRGLVRSAGALAAAVLLALSGALALPAQAQTTPTLSIANAEEPEGDDLTFTWTLTPAAAAEVTATWTVSFETGDTAGLDDLDYVALSDATGTLTIAANETTGTLEVSTGIDTDNEADETFTMTLSSVSTNATLGTAIATGTIINDDAPAAPTDFEADVGDTVVELSWDAPALDANITHHEFRYKEGDENYSSRWVDIPNSAPGGTNEASFTVTGLTNEVAHTFQLQAVNDADNSTAVEDGPLTPTPGICDRTEQVRDALLDSTGVGDCAAVTVADLATVTTVDLSLIATGISGITALKSGDFAGLTALTLLAVGGQSGLTSLPSDVFSGLSALTTLSLAGNALGSLPSGVFSGLSALTNLALNNNSLGSLPSNVFSELSNLDVLSLDSNQLTAVPGISGLSALTVLRLGSNDIASIPSNAFSSLTALGILNLSGNDLTSLPNGLFTGLTALGTGTLFLHDNPNTGDVLPLTVTVEKVGTDQARAKVLAGAPFDVEFMPTVVNGALPASDTKLAVDAGDVNGTAVTVTRTTGTTAPVTVDIDLSSQPSLPTNHSGYTFAKAAGSEPVAILRESLLPNPAYKDETFDLWRTTITVGVLDTPQVVLYGYSESTKFGSISTDADFGFPPWNPPHKHHVDRDGYITVGGIWVNADDESLNLQMPELTDTGNVTLWLGHKRYPLSSETYGISGYSWADVDLDWEADDPDTTDVDEADKVSVVLSYDRLLPSAPQNVSVTAPRGEDKTLEVNWGVPEFGGTFPIECYLVEFRHPSGDVNKRKQSYPGSRGTGKGCGKESPTSVKRTDLEPGVRYEVLVQALSGDGFGEWSDMKTAPRTNRGRALGARFVSPPERHDGEKRIKVRVEFSEAPENVGADGVEVEGGAVTSVSPVGGNAPGGAGTGSKSRSIGNRNAGQQDREVVWEFEIEPDSDGDVTVSLDAGRPCDEEGAICTADGRSLSEGISTTVEGPDEGPAPLTASFTGLPEAHDGESAFRFRVAFSEPIAISFRSLREDAFQVAGGRVTRGKRVDRRKDLFEITVEPDGAGEVAVSLPAGRECSVSGAICTWGPPRKQLANTPTATVAGPAGAPLTASFEGVPSEHDGETAFKLRIAFSEPLSRMSGRRLRSDVVAVSGGRATAAGRVDRRRDLWKLTVEPDSLADVTVTLEAGAACDTPAAVCTADGRALSNTISTTVRGPVAVSVADARAEEGTDETIDFAVTLSRAASGPVAVAYATADGTATAGEDYTRTSGTLSFDPGETEKTVRVPVLDDAIDEGEETFTLRLTNASGAVIADGEAIGTIENSDPLQKMWLSRFGRTVAGQVVDAVAGRLSGPAPGSQVTLGGQSIDLSSLSADSVDARRTLAGALGAAEDDDPLAGPGPLEAARAGSWDDPETGGTVRGLTGRELLLGSSFHLAAGGGEAGGPGYAAWGRIAVGGFEAKAPAEKGDVRLDGEVTTGILGADAQWERWLAGVALSVSEGEGSFDQPGVDTGTVESSLTSVNPYVRYEASDRLSVWGLLGYGTGDMTMTQAANDNRGEIVTRTDISMRLGAAGARGVLLKAGEDGGIDLALRGDAFLVQMDWEKVSNETDTGADASRLRLLLEAGRPFLLGEGAVLTPALELGLRHDGGDAETGTGVEVGGRIRYTDSASGLTVEANARKLIAHEDSGYEEWGAGGAVRLDPGASGRGLSLSLAPVWGTPSSGVERLWSARDAAGLVRDDDFEAERRLEGEVGYGFGAPRGLGVVTPYAGLSLADGGGRAWRMGARWQVMPDLTLGLEGTRRAAANDDEAPQHGLMLRGAIRW